MENAVYLTAEKAAQARNSRVSVSLLVNHEWRQLSRERILWLMTILLTGLMIYATFNGTA